MTATAPGLVVTADWYAPARVRLNDRYNLRIDLRPVPGKPGMTDHIVLWEGKPIGYLIDLPDRFAWQPMTLDGDLLTPTQVATVGYMRLVAYQLDLMNGAI